MDTLTLSLHDLESVNTSHLYRTESSTVQCKRRQILLAWHAEQGHAVSTLLGQAARRLTERLDKMSVR